MSLLSAFEKQGDDFFVFVSMVASVLQGDPKIDPALLHWIIDLGLIAAIAHKVFYPNTGVQK